MRSSESGPDAAQLPAAEPFQGLELAEAGREEPLAPEDAAAALFRGWLAGHKAELAARAKAEAEEAEANVRPLSTAEPVVSVLSSSSSSSDSARTQGSHSARAALARVACLMTLVCCRLLTSQACSSSD